MSHSSLSQVLESRYPKYISVKEIIKITGLTKGSIYNSIRGLKKREEIEFIVIPGSGHQPGLVTFYRLKLEENKNE